MNSLELVRKLYEGETDLETLKEELDESSREELQQLIEARDALAKLPRRKPAAGVVDAVVNDAVRPEERRSPLTLLLTNRTLHRLAAAAVVVVAVGVGYLTLRTDALIVDQAQQLPSLATEAQSEARQRAPKDELEETLSFRDDGLDVADRVESPAENAPSSPEPEREMTRSLLAKRVDGADAPKASEGLELNSEETAAGFAMLDADALAPDSALLGEADEAGELLSWDQEENALRTFFWQVRALDRRSPADEWEEAVPLEGSFEYLERQQPGSDRWLQTGSER